MFGTGTSGAAIGQLNYPIGVCVSTGNDPMVYVAEEGNHRIQVFRVSDGAHVR